MDIALLLSLLNCILVNKSSAKSNKCNSDETDSNEVDLDLDDDLDLDLDLDLELDLDLLGII